MAASEEEIDMVTAESETIEDNSMEQDDDSSSSSQSEDSDNDDEKIQKIIELEKQIEQNPYMYNNHVELIQGLREEGELDKLRTSREYMSQMFPLTSDLWLEWVRDEIKLASTTESDRIAVNKLFDRAVEDYMSVDVWLEYVQYAIGGMNSTDGIGGVRKTFERALTAVGLHVAKGAVIWEAYREFESILLNGLQASSEKELSDEQKKELQEQKNRLKRLFTRQLSVPLLDMKNTYKEFKEFLNGEEIDSSNEKIYQKALDKLSALLPYEQALLGAKPPKLKEYHNYIKFELSQGDPSRIQCIFERALIDNCLVFDLWLQYTRYLSFHLKIPHISLGVHERASRNCPWSTKLWQNYILTLERSSAPHDKIKAIVDKALASGFTQEQEYRDIWMTFLNYLRRRIDWEGEHAEELKELRDTFQRSIDHLQNYFSSEADANGSIRQYWATLEAKYCKNMDEARRIWNDMLAEGLNRQAAMWFEYIDLERLYGDSNHCRKLFHRAVQSTHDWPETICENYLKFERLEGSLEQWDIAVIKCETQLKKVNERQTMEAEKEANERKALSDQRRKQRSEKRYERKEELKLKRKHEELHEDKDGFKIPRTPSFKSQTTESPKKPKIEDVDHREYVKPVARKDDRTVFLSNLAYAVEEDTVRSFFGSTGEVTSLRLVRDFKGRSKGYCYVEFKTIDSYEKALSMDRQMVEGRPVFISPYEDKKTAGPSLSKFKYSMALEKNKLFIKNLPPSYTKEKLEHLFKQHGKLKEVRLVTYRNGNSKGLAYVEFMDANEASQAVIKTDGTEVEGQEISVAISNPPQRGQAQGTVPLMIPSLGRGQSAVRGQRKSMVSLLPRSIQRTQGVAVTSSINQKDSIKNGDTETAPSTAKMSNDDFRNLLLKK